MSVRRALAALATVAAAIVTPTALPATAMSPAYANPTPAVCVVLGSDPARPGQYTFMPNDIVTAPALFCVVGALDAPQPTLTALPSGTPVPVFQQHYVNGQKVTVWNLTGSTPGQNFRLSARFTPDANVQVVAV
jgi:hypothetical protein